MVSQMKQTIRQRLILKAVTDEYKKTHAYKLMMAKRFLNSLEILNWEKRNEY